MNTTKHEKNNILLQFWVKETPFKKKKVSVWHTMKWTSRLWLPKNFGSLHIMIFRYCGNILVSYFKVKGVKKIMFRCHTLTHGTDLRRLPPGYIEMVYEVRIQFWCYKVKFLPPNGGALFPYKLIGVSNYPLSLFIATNLLFYFSVSQFKSWDLKF